MLNIIRCTHASSATALMVAIFAAAPLAVTKAVESDPRPAFVTHDITFAVMDGHELKLDLYMPSGGASVEKPPLIVWVHGGAWRAGSRTDVPIRGLIEHGYGIASVDYRLSPVAPFPAQVHDIHEAIRFLRNRGNEYGFDSRRIAIAGSSAGGHLAALVGVTAGNAELRGEAAAGESFSAVSAIIDLYGPTNLTTILPQSTPHGLSVRVPALELLLGGQPEDNPDLAKLASPVFHVDAADPPLLIIHGDQDPQVPINQSHELHAAYKQHGRPVQFEVIPGAAHGGKAFYDDERMKLMRRFLDEYLRDASR